MFSTIRARFGRLIAAALAFVAVFVATVSEANAKLLILKLSGVLDSSAGVDGTPFGASPLPFTVTTPFDTANLVDSMPGIGVYGPATSRFAIQGQGTLVTGNDMIVELVDPSNAFFPGFYFPALVEGGVFAPGFFTATPPLDALNPAPTVFSNLAGFLEVGGDFDLANGHVLKRRQPIFRRDSGCPGAVFARSAGSGPARPWSRAPEADEEVKS
jgi:hypothetical protein